MYAHFGPFLKQSLYNNSTEKNQDLQLRKKMFITLVCIVTIVSVLRTRAVGQDTTWTDSTESLLDGSYVPTALRNHWIAS